MNLKELKNKMNERSKEMMQLVKKEIQDALNDDFDIHVCEIVFDVFGSELSDEEAESNEVMEIMTDIYNKAATQCYSTLEKALKKVGKKTSTRYIAEDNFVYDTKDGEQIADCDGNKMAEKIVKALNG